jgi:serine protease
LRANQGGRLLPGYDFVSDPQIGNDGTGTDSDPSDPGDWVTSADVATTRFSSCDVSDSSWHGTRVSGIIAALSNNSAGISGINWRGWILPVRVLGKCGGFDSDIIAGMQWAGGIHVNGVPDNPYPANVINMSLGAGPGCPTIYADTVVALRQRNVLVVASAGNEGGPVDSPADCPGVAAIAGLRHAGTKVGFSSLGPEIALSAPGGNCVNTNGGPCLFSIDTTSNLGITSPGANSYTDQTNFNVGTSFSAPIVSGIAGLMLAVNGNLTPDLLIARLREGASKPFPVSADTTIPNCHVPASNTDLQTSECNCTTQTCGAGMANASGAVAAALRPIAAVALPATVSAGQSFSLAGSGAAACGHNVAGFAWSVQSVSGGAALPALSGADTATVTSTAPAAGGSYVLRLTVTDEQGRIDTVDVALSATAASSSAPAATGANACKSSLAGLPSITISPASASLRVAAAQSFTTSLASSITTWKVNDTVGGNATLGTISSAGVYTAPSAVPTPATVTITAESSLDASRKASSQVTVTAAPTTTQPSGSSGGGGGGALDGLSVLLLAVLVCWRLYSCMPTSPSACKVSSSR